jgi:hypothetical protein
LELDWDFSLEKDFSLELDLDNFHSNGSFGSDASSEATETFQGTVLTLGFIS